MKAVFADTFYFLPLLNERDAAHDRAVAASRTPGLQLVTTEFVLLELADALFKPGQREQALSLWNVVETEPAFRIIPASTALLNRGRGVYRQRQDKEWSLTDCISFVVMQEEQLGEVLTGDRHFEQAGFKPLLA
jgi:predicted nucleic acid-binding protein